MTWVAEYSPDSGIERQVFFGHGYEAEEFCEYMNGTDLAGIGCAFLWYCYEFKLELTSLEDAKRLYIPKYHK